MEPRQMAVNHFIGSETGLEPSRVLGGFKVLRIIDHSVSVL